MSNQWSIATVDDIKDPSPHSIAMGPFGSDIKTDNFVPSGVPVIRGGNLNAEHFHDDDFVFLTERKADELSAANAFPGDIVFTHRGTLGQVAIIPEDSRYPRYIVSQSQMKLTCNKGIVDPLFIFYYFKSPIGQRLLLANTSTTGVPAISRPVTSLKSIKVPIPSLAEQQAIAYMLSSLDDKIERNRQMNETLEGIARALFKSWFVDFDPVRAKVEGRQPYGMDAEIAMLFPDRFEDSLLGKIPQGWEVTRLASELEILSGGTPKTSKIEYWGGSIPWVSIVDTVPGPYIIRTEKTITELGVEHSHAKILPFETIIITSRGTVGNCALLSKPMAMNQSCYGLQGKENIGQLFLFHQVRNQISKLKAGAHGSVFDTITRNTFDKISVICPKINLSNQFELTVRPLFDQILNNQRQSMTLSALRDALLPKLLSGAIRVKDAEKAVESVL